MGNIINLVLDIVIIVLLVVAIIQCVRLWRKLSVFNESRKEMDATIRQFFEASAKAELAIRNSRNPPVIPRRSWMAIPSAPSCSAMS